MIWKLRYRHATRGVSIDHIEARDIRMAELVGQAFCASIPATRYIGIEAFIVATEAILKAPVAHGVDEAIARAPDLREQAERLAQRHAGKGPGPVDGVASTSGTGRVGA